MRPSVRDRTEKQLQKRSKVLIENGNATRWMLHYAVKPCVPCKRDTYSFLRPEELLKGSTWLCDSSRAPAAQELVSDHSTEPGAVYFTEVLSPFTSAFPGIIAEQHQQTATCAGGFHMRLLPPQEDNLLAHSITASWFHLWRSVVLSVLAKWQLPQKHPSPCPVIGWPLFLTLIVISPLSPRRIWRGAGHSCCLAATTRQHIQAFFGAESCLQLTSCTSLLGVENRLPFHLMLTTALPPATSQRIWCVLAALAP